MHLWSNNDLNESLRTSNIQYLRKKVFELGAPSNWHISIASRSVSVSNPKRTRCVKVDDAGVLTLDVTYKGKITSTRFDLKAVERAWPMAEQAIKANMRLEQNGQKQKEQLVL